MSFYFDGPDQCARNISATVRLAIDTLRRHFILISLLNIEVDFTFSALIFGVLHNKSSTEMGF